jgi:hypothetical protein
LTIPGLKGKRSRDQYKKLVSQYIDAIPVEYSPEVKAELVPLMMEEDRLKMQATMQPEESALKRSTELKRQKVTQDLDAVIAREEGITPEEIEPTVVPKEKKDSDEVTKQKEYTDVVEVQKDIRETEELILEMEAVMETRKKAGEKEAPYRIYDQTYEAKEEFVAALKELGTVDPQSISEDMDAPDMNIMDIAKVVGTEGEKKLMPVEKRSSLEILDQIKEEKGRLVELKDIVKKKPAVYKIGETEYKNKDTFLSEVEKLERRLFSL